MLLACYTTCPALGLLIGVDDSLKSRRHCGIGNPREHGISLAAYPNARSRRLVHDVRRARDEPQPPRLGRHIATRPLPVKEDETQLDALNRLRWRGIGLLGLITCIMVVLGFPRAFTGLPPYDDEGFYLLSLRTLARRGRVYSHIYSAYGPFYHFATLGLLAIFRIPLTVDGGRTFTLALWVAIAVATAMFTWRETRSTFLAAVAGPLAFVWLTPLVNAPLQPAGMAFALTFVLLYLMQHREWWCGSGAAAIGSVCMALVLVKINLGIFTIAAVGCTLVAFTAAPGWLRWFTYGTALALPLCVLGSALSEWNMLLYALTVECGVGALILAAPRHRIPTSVTWPWLVAGFVGTLVATMALSLAFGENVGAIIEATIVNPLRYVSSQARYPVDMTWPFVASALSLVALYALVARDWRWLGFVLRAVGLALVLVALFFPMWQFVTWALVPILLLPRHAGVPAERSARVALAALIVFNELQAYPVAGISAPYAGGQAAFATFLTVPASLLVTRDLIDELRGAQWRPQVAEVGATLAVATIAAVLGAEAFLAMGSSWDTYRSDAPLRLPGSELIRVPARQAASLGVTVDDIRDRSCTSLITYPGMLSFYVWTGLPPPPEIVLVDGINWRQPTLRVSTSAALSRARNVCLVTNPSRERNLSMRSALPMWPALERQLHAGFGNPVRHGVYVVSARASLLANLHNGPSWGVTAAVP